MFFKGHVERAQMDVCNLGKKEKAEKIEEEADEKDKGRKDSGKIST